MALSYIAAGNISALSGASPDTRTVQSTLRPGDVLVVAMAYDNSGGSGADPLTNFAIATAAGSLSVVSTQTGLNDPGAVSAGLAIRVNAYLVTSIIPTGTNITISWTGTVVVRMTQFVKVTSSTGSVSYRTNSGATGTNVVASAAPALTTPSVNNGELVLCWYGFEESASVTGDADTTNGTWGTLIASTSSGSGQVAMAVGVQGKVVTATATQAFNPTTATASDWIVGALIFTELPAPTITQAAYRLYADGTQAASTALAAENTAYTADVTSGDVNVQVRARLQSTNTGLIASTDDFQCQYEKNASGVWARVDGIIDTYNQATEANPLINPTFPGRGQSFMGDGTNVAKASLKLTRVGSPSGNLRVDIYAHSGTYGTNGIPTGTALASSSLVIGSSVPTTEGFVDFTFDGTFTVANGTPYVLVLTSPGNLFDASNYYSWVAASAVINGPGNNSYYNGTTWASLTADHIYILTGVAGAVVPFDSANLTEGAATTNRLTAGTGSFVAGKVSEDGVVDALGWTANNYTEVLYSVTLKQTLLANSDTLRFRVLRNAATTGLTYTQTPTINVTKSALTGQPKIYGGATFAKKPLKVYGGASFAAKPVKVWTGSTWKTLT